VNRQFEKKVLGKIIGPQRHEVTGCYRRLLNEELHDLCFTPDVTVVMI
jgi:hypothetical protein